MALTDGRELIEPSWYGEHGPPHDIWSQLRLAGVHRQSHVPECD